MRRDLVLSPFGGDARALLEAAIRAEDEGYDGVWVFDHVSSLASLGAPGVGASRDPFAVLGGEDLVLDVAGHGPRQLAHPHAVLEVRLGALGPQSGPEHRHHLAAHRPDRRVHAPRLGSTA